jgi:hypothetical protein
MSDDSEKTQPSYSLTRACRRQLSRFALTVAALGIRFALQLYRDIGRLFTFHPGERCEIDYTKWGVFLFPNRSWDSSVLFQVGVGVDHSSTAIKGYTITPQPTALSAVRLYKNCVLPSRLWLSPALAEKYGDEFDVCGIDRLVAMDNARDLNADAMLNLILLFGTIVLILPPKRGDLKGKVERTLGSLEQMFVEALPGYVPNVYKFTDARNKALRESAFKKATLTVAEFEEQLLLAIIAYNWQPHPDLKKPRIVVYREGLEAAPPLLPVGRTQIDALFSMTYSSTVTREGVQAETWHYNSPELQEFCRVGGAKVQVHVPVDDVRTAIVFHPELVEPMLVPLTTHRFDGPTPIELARLVIEHEVGSIDRVGWDHEGQATTDRFFNRLADRQQSPKPVKGGKRHTATAAAVQAAEIPPVDPPLPRPADDSDLDRLFGNPIA